VEIVVDTSFLLSLYLGDCHSACAKAQVIEAGQALIVSPLARLEFTNGLEQWLFRKQISELQTLQLKNCFRNDFDQGQLIFGGNLSAQCWKTAERVSKNHTKKLGTRSLDILHVSFALETQVSHFWSFDHKQRQLAQDLGLSLNPMS